MITISAPYQVKRGEMLKGSASITTEELQSARGVEITFENVIEYQNLCYPNLSTWKFQKTFALDQVRAAGGKLEFEFAAPPGSPPTYTGQNLRSMWFIDVKIDIPLGFDRHERKEVVVLR